MKIKKLILSVLTLSVFLISCSKEEINGVNIQPKESIEQPIPQSITELSSESTQNARTSTETNFKAYVFIETRINGTPRKVVEYLQSTPRNPLSTGTRFLSFFVNGITSSNFRDLNNYYSIPFWNKDSHLKVIVADVPQVISGMDSNNNPIDSYNNLMDSYNNPKFAYNFTTVKIPKGTFNDFGWVTVLIPISAMNNDTKRQREIGYYAKSGTRITSSGNNEHTIIKTNTALSSYVINYTGNVIPQGQYRVYSTHSGTGMMIRFNSSNDVYIRGISN
jgi:hypothetical protein